MTLASRLFGFMCLFFGLFFIQSAPIFAQSSPQIQSALCAGANLNVYDTSCAANGDAEQTFNNLIRKIINILSLIVGVVAVIMIIIGGLRYVTSGGSDTGITSAKNTIMYAIIGLVIVALAQVLVRFVLRQLNNT